MAKYTDVYTNCNGQNNSQFCTLLQTLNLFLNCNVYQPNISIIVKNTDKTLTILINIDKHLWL